MGFTVDLSSGLFPSAQSKTQSLTESLKLTLLHYITLLTLLLFFSCVVSYYSDLIHNIRIISFQKFPNASFTRLMEEVSRRDELIGGHLYELKVQI